jgi:ribosomal-protein-alanine N-acetyltransferase
MNDLRIDRLRWWHLPEVALMEIAIFGPEAWSEGLLWTELSAGNEYRAVFEGDRILAVDASARRRGVARMLMDDLLGRARAGGAKAVFLEVAVDNVPAQRLYDGYGFYGIGVRRNYYQHTGTDAAVMRMDL